MPGPKSRALTRDQVSRLWRFQRSNRYSLPQLKLAMSAPFKWGVLGRALEGERIWVINADFIVDWLDKNVPAPLFHDRKMAAANDEPDENGNGHAVPARLRSE